MAQEHQEYIQTKVNPTLENLVTQVLLERPENPVPFMIRWLAEQTKAPPAMFETGEVDKLKREIDALQVEVKELEAKLSDGSATGPGQPVSEAEHEESEEDDDDDQDAVDLPPPSGYMNKGPRQSVSAEAYGQFNQRQEFKAPVHAKTEDEKQRILTVLLQSFLFNTLEKEDLDIIVNAMIEKPIPSGERIIREGEDGDVMYLIMQGSCDCLKRIADEEQVVKTCASGDFFGELALLYNCPRAASVQAKEDTVLCQLDRETFNHIVRDGSMKKREMYEDFLKSVPILEKLGNYERSQLADSLRKEAVKAGETIVRQGDNGDKFYLIENGELTASKSYGGDDSKDVMYYKRGDYFGELALLQNDVRAATVVATSDATLLWIDGRTFKQLLGCVEDVMKLKAEGYAK